MPREMDRLRIDGLHSAKMPHHVIVTQQEIEHAAEKLRILRVGAQISWRGSGQAEKSGQVVWRLRQKT